MRGYTAECKIQKVWYFKIALKFWNGEKSQCYFCIFKPDLVIKITWVIWGKVILICVAMQVGILQFSRQLLEF